MHNASTGAMEVTWSWGCQDRLYNRYDGGFQNCGATGNSTSHAPGKCSTLNTCTCCGGDGCNKDLLCNTTTSCEPDSVSTNPPPSQAPVNCFVGDDYTNFDGNNAFNSLRSCPSGICSVYKGDTLTAFDYVNANVYRPLSRARCLTLLDVLSTQPAVSKVTTL